MDLYASITMDVKKPAAIYETYMWVLHLKWPFIKDVGIAQCSF